MEFEWDEAKATANLAKHGLAFEFVYLFEFAAAEVHFDRRRNYGEVREVATGPIGNRLHVLVFARRAGVIRVISLRKANLREALRYLARSEGVHDDRA